MEGEWPQRGAKGAKTDYSEGGDSCVVRLLDEQFEVIERNERELDAAFKRSEALRQSILKKAFDGRLVLQDPADEPASVLLARLRGELAPKRSVRAM